MSFSREFRYRNLVGQPEEEQPKPTYLILAGVAVLLIICCGCLGVVIGFTASGRSISNPLAGRPKATATLDPKAPVPLKSKAAGEGGLEVTVTSFQRPLQVQGLTKLAADQEFVLVSVSVRNTKTTGAAVKISPADFKLKGDGGLAYDANPKSVVIDDLMMPSDTVGPGKTLQRELIYQVAKDDSGLKLTWTSGKTSRVFALESDQ